MPDLSKLPGRFTQVARFGVEPLDGGDCMRWVPDGEWLVASAYDDLAAYAAEQQALKEKAEACSGTAGVVGLYI